MPLARHLAVVVTTGLALLALPGAASGAVIPVEITGDIFANDDDCSLVEAIAAADANADGSGGCVATPTGGAYGDDTIDLDGLVYEIDFGEIQLDDGSGTLSFDGVPGSTTIDADQGVGLFDTGRIFDIEPGAIVEIEGVTLKNGLAPAGVNAGLGPPGGAGGNGGSGGCIFSEGTLTLVDSAVRDCQAGIGGAGAAGSPGDPGGNGGNGGLGGGIFSLGDLTLDNTEVTGNDAGAGGNGGAGGAGMDGGVGGAGGTGGSGGGIVAAGPVEVIGGTIANNVSGAGGAGGTGGDDTATPGNGGVGGDGGPGGGVAVDGGLTMGNVAVSGNSAGNGGDGGDGGGGGPGPANGADGGDGGNGGGLATAVGAAQLDTVALDGNQAGDGGDGGFSQNSQNGDGGMGGGGGGWYSENTLPELLGSTVTGNAAGERGGLASFASENDGGAGGGIRVKNALLTVRRSTIAGNSAGPAGFGTGGSGGGLSLLESGMDMQDTAVTGNQAGDGAVNAAAGGDGGGIHVDGTAGSDVNVGNSTIAENSAGSAVSDESPDGRGGGIMQADTGPSVFLSTSTVAGNSVPAGSAGAGLHSVATFTLLSTVIAGNQAGTVSANCFGSFLNENFTLVFGDGSCPGTVGDPKLGPLANNGGPTETMGLNAGSAALNKIPQGSAETCPPTDQRGVGRPVGGACDIGAFEGVLPAAPGPGGPAGPARKAAFGKSTLIRLSLRARTIKSKGPVAVVIANGNPFRVTGKLSAMTTKPVASAAAKRKRKAKRISLKAKAFTVAGSSKKTVKLKLPAKLRRLLKRKGKLSLQVKAVVTDPSGNRRTVSRVVKLKLKKPKRKTPKRKK